MFDFTEELVKIWNDHHSGSAEILQQYIDLLKKHTDVQDQNMDMLKRMAGNILKYSPPDKNSLLKLIIQSKERHSTFMVVRHFLDEMIEFLQADLIDWRNDLKNKIMDYESRWNNVNEGIASVAGAVFDMSNKTILLHSNSSAVKNFFSSQKAHSKKIRIIQTESRPLMEGRIQAEFLAGSGYQVKLITDSAIGRYAGSIEMSILGADAIYKDFFVNKCGSFPIALLCREQGIPLYVLADSRKIWSGVNLSGRKMHKNLTDTYREKSVSEIAADETYPENIRPADELWKNPPDNVIVENYYFERIPNELVHRFITEKGSL
jgi:translation initiation factor 2B subunit (eIF-2B alpha/beta/delta family)